MLLQYSLAVYMNFVDMFCMPLCLRRGNVYMEVQCPLDLYCIMNGQNDRQLWFWCIGTSLSDRSSHRPSSNRPFRPSPRSPFRSKTDSTITSPFSCSKMDTSTCSSVSPATQLSFYGNSSGARPKIDWINNLTRSSTSSSPIAFRKLAMVSN